MWEAGIGQTGQSSEKRVSSFQKTDLGNHACRGRAPSLSKPGSCKQLTWFTAGLSSSVWLTVASLPGELLGGSGLFHPTPAVSSPLSSAHAVRSCCGWRVPTFLSEDLTSNPSYPLLFPQIKSRTEAIPFSRPGIALPTISSF